MIYLHVALGGMAGAVARFALGGWISSQFDPSFPWATLLINASGSLLLGFLISALPVWGATAELRALVAVGFCGSFTTFSTFGYESAVLMQAGNYGAAAAYVSASTVIAIASVFAGIAAGAWLS